MLNANGIFADFKDEITKIIIDKSNLKFVDEEVSCYIEICTSFDNKSGKTHLFLILYNNFLKLDIRSFFMLKTIDTFVLKLLDNVAFIVLIEPIMATKIKIMKRKPRRSHSREMIIPDRNDE